MRWQPLVDRRLGDLVRFLGPREHFCTAFTERLLENGRASVPRGDTTVFVRTTSTGRINGAILQVRSGLYYPVLDETDPGIEQPAVDLMRKRSRRIYSVMGRTADVTCFETALGRPPVQAIEYHLMTQDIPPAEVPPPRLPPDFTIYRSAVEDAERLAGLQREYEIEEVLLPGNSFDPVASLRHLKSVLSTQLVIHATSGGKIIAKAGTNARGLFHDQVGGVFTDPGYRSRGVGSALMRRLLAMIAADHKNATLFAKMDNGPAITMYRNLGFRVLDGFRISYYR